MTRGPDAATLWALLFSFLLFLGIGSYPLFEPDETRNGEVIREVVQEGHWLPPTVNGRVRYQKPPLFYWFGALSFEAFGGGELSVRMVSALSAALLGVLLYAWGGALAALAFVSSAMPFFYGRIARVDMLLTLFVAAAVFFLVRADGRRIWYAASSLFCALAFLTKGPVGVLIPAMAVVPHLVLSRTRVPVGTMALVFAAVSVPPFLLLEASWPGYCYRFFWMENVVRYLEPVFRREEPFYYFFPVVLLGLMPWTAVLFVRFRELLDWAFESVDEAVPFLCWALLPVLFFSLSKSKLPHYVLPAFPAWAYLVSRADPPEWFIRRVIPAFWVLFLVAVLVVMPRVAERRSFSWLAQRMALAGDVRVVAYKERLYGPSFYLGVKVPEVEDAGLRRMASSHRRLWVIAKPGKRRRIEDVTSCRTLLVAKKGKYALFLLECR